MLENNSSSALFQEAGIGIMYFPGLEELLTPHLSEIDLIEIEPQTLWVPQDASCSTYQPHPGVTERLLSYQLPLVFHGVGYPIAGSMLPDAYHFQVMQEHIRQLHPLWISEHLSFNTFLDQGQQVNTSFLLPQLQTEEGIRTAVAGIQQYSALTGLPFAFETGVNYLKPRPFEMGDGQFASRIAEEADCHILLDVHNIMANQLNGRQSVDDFLAALPPERVCEIHIAGGFYYDHYYLDAHSGASSPELFEMLEKIVRSLPALKALIFEMLPDYADQMSTNDMGRQLQRMRRIWDQRGKSSRQIKRKAAPIPEPSPLSVPEWEGMLGQAVLGWPDENPSDISRTLRQDPGLKVIQDLVFHFRASALVSSLKLSTRLLRLSLGETPFLQLLKDYFSISPPALFAYKAAGHFGEYLRRQGYDIPYLDALLELELSTLDTIADHQPRSVRFGFNPFPVIRSLTEKELPGVQDIPMEFILEIRPDEQMNEEELMGLQAAFHN